MEIEVYGDESNPEILRDRTANPYLVLGSVWTPASYRPELKTNIEAIKLKHNYNSEIKWNKVAPSTLPFYLDLIDYFFSSVNLHFRGILVASHKIDLVRFQQDDGELSFYKFYYQLLHHWIRSYNDYRIFLDHKVNKNRSRVHDLKKVLSSANLFAKISDVQALPSKEVLGIQLADLLTGALNGKSNGRLSSQAKLTLIAKIEAHIGHPIQPTYREERKFNVFKINLQGGF